jgi:hypothetical protein
LTAEQGPTASSTRAFTSTEYRGDLTWLCSAITLTRDLILLTIGAAHSHVLFTLAARAILITAAILNIAGFAQLPSTMPFDQDPPASSTKLRLAAAMLVILLVSFNLMVLCLGVATSKPMCAQIGVVGVGIFHKPRMPSFARASCASIDENAAHSNTVLATFNTLTIPPALYLFINVSVTDDTAAILQRDKLFFYLSLCVAQFAGYNQAEADPAAADSFKALTRSSSPSLI